MKNTNQIKFVLFLFSFLFLMNYNTKADVAICYPDCEDSEWITPAEPSLQFMIGDCEYWVSYYFRHACDTWCDILITSIRAVQPDCDNIDPLQMLNIATARIIQNIVNDPDIFTSLTGVEPCVPRHPGDSDAWWRVSKKTCWKVSDNFYYNPEFPPTHYNYASVYNPCIVENCCLTWYRVEMDHFGQVIITETSSIYEDCPEEHEYGCVPVCGGNPHE